VIVEGYTDVILLHGAGVTNACAACGTALTPEHVRLLKRYTNRIHLVFDGDAAGVRAMDRGLELLAGEDVDLSLVVLPGDEDPADFVGRCGADAFREALRGGRDLCDFKLAVVAGKEDLSTPGGMARAADEMLALVRKVRHPVRRGEYLRRTAEGLRTSEEALRARLSQQERPAPAAGPAGSPAPAAGPRALHEGLVVEALLGDAALAGRARSEMPPERFSEPALREAVERILALLERGGRAALSQLIDGEPSGALAEVATRILDQEARGFVPDYGRMFEDALECLGRAATRDRRRELLAALKAAEAAHDPVRKRELLETLHRTC